MKVWWLGIIMGLLFVSGLFCGSWLMQTYPDWYAFKTELLSPFVADKTPKALPLLKYSIPALATQDFAAESALQLLELQKTEPDFQSYTGSFMAEGKKISALINIPTTPATAKTGYPLLIMVRGYVPPENYLPGMGTKNAAEFFARQGFVTVAPDFLGYGSSDPDYVDTWESRFIKPMQLITLIKTLETYPALNASDSAKPFIVNPKIMGIWAHSNGGQITLTALEILQKPIPATFWAPVLAPFPYSLLYFSDENADEGKATRSWIAQFERDYDVFDFSLTQHLDLLHGEFNLHHGTADDSALKSWSDEFLVKVKAVNEVRPKEDKIIFNYFSYPGANHNLQPGWDAAIARDLNYFKTQLEL